MSEPTTYLILATPRSGSTLLCQALAGTGLAGDPKEFFGARMAYWMGRWETPTPRTFVPRLIAERATPNGVFGAKLLWAHLLRLERLCRTQPGYSDPPLAAILADLFPNLRYVWITRDDKVRQAISYWKARESGVWGQRGERRTRPLKPPAFDFAGIDELRRRVEREEAAIAGYFAESGIVPWHVVYEDLVRAYEPTTRAILGYLGIAPDASFVLADPRTEKLADRQTDDWVERYQLMKAASVG